MLTYQEYFVTEKKWEVKDTFVLKVKPTSRIKPDFKPGQYIVIKNPTYRNKEEEHIFSIVSSPHQNYLEFCIKIFGDWTKYLSKIVKGDKLLISNPSGKFVWDTTIEHAVFLIGGIGISPIISMLRYIEYSHQHPHLTLVYSTTSLEMIPYKEELIHFQKKLSLKLVWALGDVSGPMPNAYPGIITTDLITKEINLKQKPIFFYCGSNNFVTTIETILNKLEIPQSHIKSEARE